VLLLLFLRLFVWLTVASFPCLSLSSLISLISV
jgi:hypothetical protein